MGTFINSVECKDIKKNFGGVRALTGVSIKLKAGEVRALLGGNGSGKSTLAKILGGVVSMDSGEILVNEKKVKINSPNDAENLGIIVTSQELSMFYNLSVQFNVMLSAIKFNNRGILDQKLIKKMAIEQLEKLEHLDIAEEELSLLPDNKKYIVEFAKSLVRNPKLLIIDEITSALYSQEFDIVKNTIIKLKQQGIPIIFISHRMNEIYEICETVTVMRNGKDVLTDDLKNVSKEKLLEMMTGTIDEKEVKEKYSKSTNIDQDSLKGKNFLSASDIHIPLFNTLVSIEAMQGEFIGISGLQGQGQSDFIRSLFGLGKPVKILINEKKINIAAPIDAIRNGIGFISGNRETEGVFPVRPVYENLEAISNYILNRGKIDYNDVMSNFKIMADDINDPIKSLSGGNQQKVVIARWMITKPRILLADDPNKGVDVQARKEIHAIIKDLVNTGSTVLMVSSDDEELSDIGDLIPNTRILIMYNGKITKTLIGKEITVQNIIQYSLSRGI